MEQLAPGAKLDATGMHVPGARANSPLEIVERIGDVPYGDVYRARIDGIPLLATLIDPVLHGDARTLDWIAESLGRAQAIDHRNLGPCYGLAGVPGGRRRGLDDPCIVVQGHSDARQARAWIADRATRGRTVEVETARTIIGHVCNALAVLHGVMIHGYLGVDTVWLSTTGRVLLSDSGLGPLVPRSRRFARMLEQGRLPGIAPEQIGGTAPLGPGTDVFGLATLFLELVTGRPLPGAGTPVSALGLCGPDDLVMCLERATAPDPAARPPDVGAFKAELAEALPAGTRLDLRAPTVPAPPAAPRAPTPVLANVRPPAPLVLPPLAPTRPPPREATPPPAAPTPVAMPSAERPRTPVFVPAPGMAPPGALPSGTMAMPIGGAPMPGMPGAPGATVPVMLPHGVPAMGVMGTPVPGPAGYPAYVPVFVSVPVAPQPSESPPAAAAATSASTRPRPTATAIDLAALEELDRATRRIADAGAAEAVLELTEDVSQRTMRTVEVPAASSSTASAPAATATAGASASGLRVDLGFGEPGRTPTDPRSFEQRTPAPVAPARTPTEHRTPPPSTPPRSQPDRTPPPSAVGRTPSDRTPAPSNVGRTPTEHRTPPPRTPPRSPADRTPPPSTAARTQPDRTPLPSNVGRAPTEHRTPPPSNVGRTPTDHRTPRPVAPPRSPADRTPPPVGTPVATTRPDRTPVAIGTPVRTPPPDRMPPPLDRRAGLAFDDEDLDGAHARYQWRRHGVPPSDHALAELVGFARAGRLAPDDVLVHVGTGRQMLVADVPVLRDALRERSSAGPISPRPAPPVVVPPMMITTSRAPSPLVWILLVLVLGGVGALAWWRFG